MDNADIGEIKKLDEIKTILKSLNSSVTNLLNYTKDDDSEVRYQAIEALYDIRYSEVQKMLIDSLSDSDEFVRTISLEILGDWQNNNAIEKIITCLDDTSSLVKSEAAIALAKLEIEVAIEEIEKRISDVDDEVKLRFYFALYKLGNKEYLPLFLNGLYHTYYRIRCATVNLLEYIINPVNKDFIINLLRMLLKDEKTVSVKSTIQEAIKDYSLI